MKETVLIIEDKASMRENISEILSLADYNTLAAENGKIGLELAKTCNPDLILCDIMMPELDGYGVLRAVEGIPMLSKIPFVFITAKSEVTDFRKAMDLGADDYLIKPFNGEDILKVVDARLKKSQLMRGLVTDEGEQKSSDSKSRAFNEIQYFKGHLVTKKIKKKEVIYREGDVPNFLYYIVSGKVKVYKTNDYGKDYITEIYRDGDFFGYVSILENREHQDSTMTMEDSEIAMIPKHDFFQLLHSNNDLSFKFIKHISDTLSNSEEKLLKLAYDSARKRCAEALLFIYQKYKGGDSTTEGFPVNREDISAIAGITAESVSRNLTNFKEEGLIETNNTTIRILDLKKLENIKN